MVQKVPPVTVRDLTRLPLFILKFVGFSVEPGKSSSWIRTRKFFLATIVNLIFGLVDIIMKFLTRASGGDKLQDMIDSALHMSYLLLAMAKISGLMFMLSGHLERLLEDIDGILKENQKTVEPDDVKKLLTSMSCTWKRAFGVYLVANGLALFRPLVLLVYQLLMSQPVEFLMPYVPWCPFEMQISSGFILCYSHQTWVAVTLMCSIAGSDFLFSALIGVVCLRFKGLKRQIRMVKTYEDIKQFVVEHSALIDVCEKLEKIFSPMILFNILVASVILAFQSFSLQVRFQ